MENKKKPLEVEHHQQQELCTNRPAYRQGKKLTAVKTYTISTESQHLFIYGVPTINLRNELKKLCQNYGQLLAITPQEDYKTEIFTECYHVHYQRIQSARIAKRFLDNKSFYGGILHVCYAPEFETVEDTRRKLFQRTRDVMNRLNRSNPKMHQIDTEVNSVQPSFTDVQDPTQQFANSYNYEYHSQPNWIHTGEASTSSMLQNNSTQIQGPYEFNQLNNFPPIQQNDTTQPSIDDTVNKKVEVKMSDKKRQQTPAYFWKEPTEQNTVTYNKQGIKRSGNFVPRQVTKKKGRP